MRFEELDKLKRLMRLIAEEAVNEGPSNRPRWEVDNDMESAEKDFLE